METNPFKTGTYRAEFEEEQKESEALAKIIETIEKNSKYADSRYTHLLPLAPLLMEIRRTKLKALVHQFKESNNKGEAINWNYLLTIEPKDVPIVVKSLQELIHSNGEQETAEKARRTTTTLQALE